MSHPARVPFPPHPAGQRVRSIVLQVDALPDGRLRVSSPHARGWAGAARNPMELARIVAQAYNEVACASYALARAEAYDLDQMTPRVSGDLLADGSPRRVRSGRSARRKAHAPEDWTRLEDGRWRSPSGRAYRPDSTAVRNVVRRRQEKGLPT